MHLLPFSTALALLCLAVAGCATPPESRTSFAPDLPPLSVEPFRAPGSLAGRTLKVAELADIDLGPGEVILTFDDGPSPTHTPAILDALDDVGVKAVFFMVGRMAAEHPETARLVAERGHTIGTHTIGHQNLAGLQLAAAMNRVEEGRVSIDAALSPINASAAPFFRFPYLADTSTLRTALALQGIVVFDADVDSFDYLSDTPDEVLARTLRRLDARGRGIILFHDIHARTASMLPDFLAALEARGYRVVHAIPRGRSVFDIPFMQAAM